MKKIQIRNSNNPLNNQNDSHSISDANSPALAGRAGGMKRAGDPAGKYVPKMAKAGP